jgi:hypothetical protein
MSKIDNITLERYLIKALSGKNYLKTEKGYKLKCNICGDGKKRNNMRGNLILSKGKKGSKFWVYKCFNEGDCPCAGEGQAWPAEKWLENTDKFLHSQYKKEIFQETSIEKQKIKLENEILIEEKSKVKRPKKKVEKTEEKFIPILSNIDNDLIKKAIEVCESRKIPKDIWSKWYVCTGGKYYNRMIIPFYDNKEKIYYFQGRSLTGQDPKYLNMVGPKDRAIYNIFNVDRRKPVIITEGPIDSMMVENGIAIIGLSISKETQEILDKMNCYYLLDNDEPGRKKSKELLLKGKNVFIWDKFTKQKVKDLNEYVINNDINERIKFENIKGCFTNSKYDLIFL